MPFVRYSVFPLWQLCIVWHRCRWFALLLIPRVYAHTENLLYPIHSCMQWMCCAVRACMRTDKWCYDKYIHREKERERETERERKNDEHTGYRYQMQRIYTSLDACARALGSTLRVDFCKVFCSMFVLLHHIVSFGKKVDVVTIQLVSIWTCMGKCERSQLLVRPFITWVLFEILDCIAKLYCNDYHFAWVIANTIRIDWMQCIAQINRIFAKKNIDFIWLMENLWNLLNRIWASSIHFGLLLSVWLVRYRGWIHCMNAVLLVW